VSMALSIEDGDTTGLEAFPPDPLDASRRLVVLSARGKLVESTDPAVKGSSFRHLGYELAFAQTFHAAQGRTCDRACLLLCEEPGVRATELNMAQIYVALSRARSADSLRLLFEPSLRSRKWTWPPNLLAYKKNS
jgi:hypothetical protein